MSEGAVKGVVVGHLGMPEGMVEAVRHITGIAVDALTPVSNRGKSPDALAAEVESVIGAEPAIIFTDLPGGSCGFAARRLSKSLPELVVISSVNLPMLVDFAVHRTMPLAELVPRLLQKGRAAITVVPAHMEGHEHRSASG